MAKMLGELHRNCPFGRDCTCNDAPGKERVLGRRLAKRRERQQWKKEVWS